MQLNQRINIKHSQSIVMTPQLRQAIKLLQFSNLELSNYIEEEIEKNPFLESKKQENTFSDNDLNASQKNNENDYENSNRWEENYNAKNRKVSHEDLSSFEDRVAAPKKSLREHLIGQILLDIPKGIERKIAMLILDVIEPSGWINIDLDSFCDSQKLDKIIAKKVLKQLQTLEPCGVFARNLGECLRIQLEEKGLFIRYFLIAVFFIIAFGLIFTDKVNYLSIINPLNFSYFVLLIGFLIFLIKLFAYVKKSFFLNQSNKVGYFPRKSSKRMSRKKID